MRALLVLTLLCGAVFGTSAIGAEKCAGNADEWCEANAAVVEAGAADRRLNDAYRKLTRQLSTAQKKSIVSAQRAWLDFRKLDCEAGLERLDRIGSPAVHQSVYKGCLTDHTEQRTKELVSFCESIGGCK